MASISSVWAVRPNFRSLRSTTRGFTRSKPVRPLLSPTQRNQSPAASRPGKQSKCSKRRNALSPCIMRRSSRDRRRQSASESAAAHVLWRYRHGHRRVLASPASASGAGPNLGQTRPITPAPIVPSWILPSRQVGKAARFMPISALAPPVNLPVGESFRRDHYTGNPYR